MSHHSTYVAFPASEHLHNLTEGFIQRMRGPGARPEPQVVEQIMSTFLQEALDAFMIKPSRLSGLSPGLMRVVMFTTDTINKASQVVVRSTVKKLDLQQNKDIAEYMDSVRHQFDGSWNICFPISPELAHTAQEGFHMAIDGKKNQAMPMMIQYFHRLTDTAMFWYFEEPLRLLKFGPILRKVADVGIATTRKATHTVVDKVIPKLDDEQARISAEYALSLLKLGPQRNDIR